MSSPKKYVYFIKPCIPLLCLVLCSCGDDVGIKWPKVFGGNEVPPEVMAEPRLVPVPAPQAAPLPPPRLGDVPLKPRDFTPQPVIDAARQDMEKDRGEAQKIQQDYQAAPPVMPSAPTP